MGMYMSFVVESSIGSICSLSSVSGLGVRATFMDKDFEIGAIDSLSCALGFHAHISERGFLSL